MSNGEDSEKFALLVDLGIITVPDDYVHASRLVTFGEQNREEFHGYYNDNINDANFPSPSRILRPSDKLRVRAFQQVVGGATTSEDRMAFLALQEAVYPGAQGASFVFEQKRDQLLKGMWYASFDKEERLWKDAGRDRRMPCMYVSSDGGFRWSLGYFGFVWKTDDVSLCFTEVED